MTGEDSENLRDVCTSGDSCEITQCGEHMEPLGNGEPKVSLFSLLLSMLSLGCDLILQVKGTQVGNSKLRRQYAKSEEVHDNLDDEKRKLR